MTKMPFSAKWYRDDDVIELVYTDICCDVPHRLGMEMGMCLYVYSHHS